MTHKVLEYLEEINEHMAKENPFAVSYLTIKKCDQLVYFH